MTTQLIQSGGIQQTFDYSALVSQIIYLDFDGELTTYHNSDLGINVDVAVEDSHLSQERIAQIVAALNEQFAGQNVKFVADNSGLSDYSTIYIGKTSSFEPYGTFAGLAETVDSGNKIKNDNAFVILDSTSDNTQITNTIAHEAGHLLGTLEHEGEGLEKYELGNSFSLTSYLAEMTRLQGEYQSCLNDYQASLARYQYETMAYANNNPSAGQTVYKWCVRGGTQQTIGASTVASLCTILGVQLVGGGTAISCYVGAGGQQYVRYDHGNASNTYLYGESALQVVWEKAYDTVVGSGATQELNCGGTVTRTCVLSGGSMRVTYPDFRLQYIEDAYINSGGVLFVSSGRSFKSLDGYTVDSGYTTWLLGNTYMGGTIQADAEGTKGVFLGSDCQFINQGVFIFGIDQRKPSDSAIIDNIQNLQNKGRYVISVTADQTVGKYILAGGVTNITDSFSVIDKNTDTTYGAISLSKKIIYGDKVYSLSVDSSKQLIFSIQVNTDTVAPVITIDADTTSRLNSVLLTAKVDDGSQIYYKTGDGNWTKYTGALTVTGTQTYYFKAKDSAENIEYAQCPVYIGGSATDGGAINNKSSKSMTLSNAVFTSNFAWFYGGAIANCTSGSMTLSNTVFTNNFVSSRYGGAIFNQGYMTLTSASFRENSTFLCGGAIDNSKTGSMTLSDITFKGNSATNGGAIYNQGNMTLSNVIFSGNSAKLPAGYAGVTNGGAIYNDCSMNLTDVRFETASDKIYNYYMGSMTFAGTISLAGNLYTDKTINATGANINLDISSYEKGNELEIISDLSKITGAASWSIVLGTSQQEGTYKLANGASAFNKSITLKNTTGSILGDLSVGKTITVNNTAYALYNSSGVLTLTVGALGKDMIVPEITSYSIVQKGYNYTFVARVTATDNETAVSDLKYKIRYASTSSGLDSARIYSGTEFEVDPSDAGRTMFYQVGVTDEAGNTAWSTASSFTVRDLTAPVLDGNPTVVTNGSNATINWLPAYDNVSVAGYHLTVDNNTYTVTGTSYDLKDLSVGIHTYSLTAYDAEKNESSKMSDLTFTIKDPSDMIAPIINNLSMVQGTSDYICTANINASDNITAVDKLIYQIKYATTASGLDSAEIKFGNSFTLTSKYAGKIIYYQVGVTDEAGNTTWSPVNNFLVSKIADPANSNYARIVNSANESMMLSNATFSKNSTWYFSGGAIYNDGSMTLRHASFNNNFAKFSHGGAIYNDNSGTMTLSDVIFSGNSAGSYGGAIYNNSGTMTLENATFIENIASSYEQCSGAAIYNGNGNMTLSNVKFIGNITRNNYGAIFNTGSMTLTSATFSRNSAHRYDAIGNYGDMTLTSASFTDHKKCAIYNDHNMILSNAVFCGNSGTDVGGAIHNNGSMTLENVSFNENSAWSGGTIVNLNDGIITLENTTFSGNTGSWGGVIYNSGSMTFNSTTFNGNIANYNGGAINNGYFNESGYITLLNVIFNGNSAGEYGGAIYNVAGSMTLINAMFNGNSAHYSGGAIYNEAQTLHLMNAHFATASDTIYNKGSMTFAGTISLAGNLYTGNEIDATDANMVFDISSYEEENDIEIISDLSKITGAASWSIEVDTSQQNGTYKLAYGAQNFNETLTVKTDTSTLGTVSVDNDLTVDGKTYSLVKNDSILSLTVVDKVVVPDPYDLSGNDNGITWKGDSDSFVGAYTKDEYAHSLVFSTDKKAVDTYGMSTGAYDWRVRNTDSETWVDGNTFTAQKSAETQKLVSDADCNGDIFFGNAVGIWEKKYAAQHVGVETWNGTGEKVQLEGKNQITDVFVGSEDANLLVLTDDAHGDALFVDDIYSACPSEIQQSRIAQIDEIRAGAGDDVIDMTSDKFFYEGDGLTIRGGSDNDTIWANHGDNKLFGDAGDDRIVGASDNDVIAGGSGDDSLHGGGGNDVFCFCKDWGHDTVEQLSDGNVTLWFASGSENNWDQEAMTYTDGDNNVKVTGVSAVTLKFGSDETTQYESLVSAGCFLSESSDKIFETEQKGVLAMV